MINIVFSDETIIAYAILGILCTAIPAAAALVYRFGFKKGKLTYTLLGAGMFFLFAMILESLLHQIMLPAVQCSTITYVVYGALAAGIFEETARFISFKLILKKHLSAETAISYGIGHGGFEAIMLCGISSLSIIAMAVSVNQLGAAEFIQSFSMGNEQVAEQLTQQLIGYSQATIGTALLGFAERIIAMALHISLSVIVMEAAMVKGRLWLYPAAIIIHALMDVPAALYQKGVLPLWLYFAIITVYTVLWCIIAANRVKFLKKYNTNSV